MFKEKSLEIIGKLTFQQVDKKGNILTERTIKNIVVETGREFILDLLINNVTYYQGNIYLTMMAAGSINNPATVDDWRLRGEGTVNEGGAICRVNLDPQTARTLTTITFHGVFTDGDFPVIPYTIGELGVFLGDRPPTSDPQDDATQRPYAMFNRLVLDPRFTKYNDGTDIRFIYEVTIR